MFFGPVTAPFLLVIGLNTATPKLSHSTAPAFPVRNRGTFSGCESDGPTKSRVSCRSPNCQASQRTNAAAHPSVPAAVWVDVNAL